LEFQTGGESCGSDPPAGFESKSSVNAARASIKKSVETSFNDAVSTKNLQQSVAQPAKDDAALSFGPLAPFVGTGSNAS